MTDPVAQVRLDPGFLGSCPQCPSPPRPSAAFLVIRGRPFSGRFRLCIMPRGFGAFLMVALRPLTPLGCQQRVSKALAAVGPAGLAVKPARIS